MSATVGEGEWGGGAGIGGGYINRQWGWGCIVVVGSQCLVEARANLKRCTVLVDGVVSVIIHPLLLRDPQEVCIGSFLEVCQLNLCNTTLWRVPDLR